MSDGPLHIAIVGKGNLGTHLFNGLSKQHTPYFVDRNLHLRGATDLVIVCVGDHRVSEVCKALPEHMLVAHTAGALPIQSGTRSGVFYPLYSFTKNAALNWSEVPILIEAKTKEDEAVLRTIASCLTQHIFDIPSNKREKLHAAAVMVNNFTNHLYTLAYEHAAQHELPVEIVHAIMRQGPGKAIDLGPKKAQTGPAVRFDTPTLEKHLDSITDQDVQTLYKLLSASIQKHHPKDEL
jgi:predicted short-subunit dehydrogenase-like oxidoreductase (DUF2520 family)